MSVSMSSGAAVTGRRFSSQNNERPEKSGPKACDSTPESKRRKSEIDRQKWAREVLRATRQGTFREALANHAKERSRHPAARERQRQFGMTVLRARRRRKAARAV